MQDMSGSQTRIRPRDFYIFGQGISFSMSPTIHRAGFGFHSLPHTYEIHETRTVDELGSLISSPSFGGASVTMPHKIGIAQYCSTISDHARIIGAVNTLIVDDATGQIRGENTDYTGLVSVIQEQSAKLSTKKLDAGLVIGAGGASRAALYALHHLGVKKIYLWNRTRKTADDIAESYSSLFQVIVMDTLQDLCTSEQEAPDVIIGTIPADKTTIDSFPRELFTKPFGICVDMSYKPRHTPLLAAAELHGANKWSTVAGVDVLLEQGFSQFESWTGKKAPKEVMREALKARDLKQKSLEKGNL